MDVPFLPLPRGRLRGGSEASAPEDKTAGDATTRPPTPPFQGGECPNRSYGD